MANAIYKPTPLPARIDLANLDTRSQLSGNSEKFPAACVLNTDPQAAPAAAGPREEAKRKSLEIIEAHLEGYLRATPEISRNFRSWLRHFHSEYDHLWFDKNLRRLEISFRPVWDGRLPTAAASKTTTASDGLADLLL